MFSMSGKRINLKIGFKTLDLTQFNWENLIFGLTKKKVFYFSTMVMAEFLKDKS